MTSRVRRMFWVLVLVAIVATGALSRALAAEPSPGAGIAVAGSALIVAISGSLALRILVVVGRHSAGRERPRLE